MGEMVARPGELIRLGFQGEKNVTTVVFDVSAYDLPAGGTWHLLFRRPRSTVPYTPITNVLGGRIRWTVAETALQRSGSGEVQLRYVSDDVAKMTVRYPVLIESSLADPGAAPADADMWVDEMGRLLSGAAVRYDSPQTLTSEEKARARANIDVPDSVENAESILNKVQSVNSESTEDQYPSAKAVYQRLLELLSKMDKANPTGTGKLSMNRKAESAEGTHSVTLGYNGTASGLGAIAEGYETVASGQYSHAEGAYTKAAKPNQHVQGIYNVPDDTGDNANYADIVGWGSSDNARKNISALTTTGELRLKKGVRVNCNDDSSGGTDLATVPEIQTAEIQTSGWSALASSDPYDYQATVTLSDLTENSRIKLLNNNPILFSEHAFAIASGSGQTLTIYSIGVPAVDVMLSFEVNER